MNQNKRFLMIGVAVVILIVVALFLWPEDEPVVDQASSPWQPTTVSYDSKCEGECLEKIVDVADIESAHLKGVKIVMRPDINDAIAQLGDCLDTIISCVDERDDPAQTAACVAASQCPGKCKNAYGEQFNASMPARAQMQGLEIIFLAKDAVCAPREAGQGR